MFSETFFNKILLPIASLIKKNATICDKHMWFIYGYISSIILTIAFLFLLLGFVFTCYLEMIVFHLIYRFSIDIQPTKLDNEWLSENITFYWISKWHWVSVPPFCAYYDTSNQVTIRFFKKSDASLYKLSH